MYRLLYQDGDTPQSFSFTSGEVLIGRSPDCHAELASSDTSASRHHFLLEVNPPAARLRDLGSLNGTNVNGVRHGGRERDETPQEAARRDQGSRRAARQPPTTSTPSVSAARTRGISSGGF